MDGSKSLNQAAIVLLDNITDKIQNKEAILSHQGEEVEQWMHDIRLMEIELLRQSKAKVQEWITNQQFDI